MYANAQRWVFRAALNDSNESLEVTETGNAFQTGISYHARHQTIHKIDMNVWNLNLSRQFCIYIYIA